MQWLVNPWLIGGEPKKWIRAVVNELKHFTSFATFFSCFTTLFLLSLYSSSSLYFSPFLNLSSSSSSASLYTLNFSCCPFPPFGSKILSLHLHTVCTTGITVTLLHQRTCRVVSDQSSTLSSFSFNLNHLSLSRRWELWPRSQFAITPSPLVEYTSLATNRKSQVLAYCRLSVLRLLSPALLDSNTF